jgi:hypothetical protein
MKDVVIPVGCLTERGDLTEESDTRRGHYSAAHGSEIDESGALGP